MRKRLLLVLLSIVGVAANLIAIPQVLWAAITNPNGSRARKIIATYDVLANVATGGDEFEYVTTRAYKASLRGNKYGCYLCKFLNWLDSNHCSDKSQ